MKLGLVVAAGAASLALVCRVDALNGSSSGVGKSPLGAGAPGVGRATGRAVELLSDGSLAYSEMALPGTFEGVATATGAPLAASSKRM